MAGHSRIRALGLALAAGLAVLMILTSSRTFLPTEQGRPIKALPVLREAADNATLQEAGLVVPERPGAAAARAWLAAYRRELALTGGRGTGNDAHAVAATCSATPRAGGTSGSTQQVSPAPAEAGAAERRPYLVLAAVGDRWDPAAGGNGWLDNPADAQFDLAVIYFGRNASWACPQCLHTWRLRGAKHQMVRNVTQSAEWAALVAGAGYRYIWTPDDDLKASACTITRFLRTAEANALLLAQPALCADSGPTSHPHLRQQPGAALRFTAFVEIMAPAYRFDFFEAVVSPTLHRAWTGWGMDMLWPYLLAFPRNSVAVVDATCVTHPGAVGPGAGKAESNYAAPSPFKRGAYEEMPALLAEWNVTPAAIQKYGVPAGMFARIQFVFETVPLPPAPALASWLTWLGAMQPLGPALGHSQETHRRPSFRWEALSHA